MNNGSDQEHIRRHERTEKILEAIAAKQEKTEDELRAFIKSQVLMGENIDKMARQVGQMMARNDRADSRMDRMEAIIEKIDLRLAEATEKLDALIDIVDHHVRDDKRHN